MGALDVFTEPPETNNTNSTDGEEGNSVTSELVTLYYIVVGLQVFSLTVSMSAGVTGKSVRHHLRHPKAVIIGLVCQLLLLPLLCFLFAASILKDSVPIAAGMVVVSSCPAGVPSTFFITLSKGDLPLGISITLFSTILAIGTMPLNIFLYTQPWVDNSLLIPFVPMVVIIIIIWVGAIIGFLVRRYKPKIAPYVTRIGSILGLSLMIVFIALHQVFWPGVIEKATTDIIFIVLILPVVGFGLGHGVSSIFGLKIRQKRSIGYCTAFVNGGLALIIFTSSYPEAASDILVFPRLYMGAQVIDCVVLMTIHLLYFLRKDGFGVCCKAAYFQQADLDTVTYYQEKALRESQSQVNLPNAESKVSMETSLGYDNPTLQTEANASDLSPKNENSDSNHLSENGIKMKMSAL